MATEQQLAACKSYLRVDMDDDDALISTLLDAAVTYLQNGGIPSDFGNALYDVAVWGLVLHWYDNRGTIAPGSANALPLGVGAIILQLSLGNSPTF